MGEEQRARVTVVCIDLHDPYRQAVRAKLPDAQIVADPLHVVRGAGEALDTVRRARQRKQRVTVKGKRGRKATWNRGLYGARHLLLRGRERLSENQRRRLCDLFTHDPVIAEGLVAEGGAAIRLCG